MKKHADIWWIFSLDVYLSIKIQLAAAAAAAAEVDRIWTEEQVE